MGSNGQTPGPTPVEGVPFVVGPGRSQPYRRRKTDRGWRHWLAVGAKAAPIVALACTVLWRWNTAQREDAEFKGWVRAHLQAIEEQLKETKR